MRANLLVLEAMIHRKGTESAEGEGGQVFGRATFVITGVAEQVRKLAPLFMEPLAVGYAEEANGSPMIGLAVNREGRAMQISFLDEERPLGPCPAPEPSKPPVPEAPPPPQGDPQRSAADGEVGVNRVGEDVVLYAHHKGERQSIICSEWNARRLLGMLSVVLGLPLQKRAAKEIEL